MAKALKNGRGLLAGLLALGLLLPAPSVRAVSFDKGGVLGVGGRAMGMGGAFTALADESSALWINPAGLVVRKDFEVGLHYGSVLGGRSADLAVAHRGWLQELDLGYGMGYRGFSTGGPFSLTEGTVIVGAGMPFSDDGRVLFGAAAKVYSASLDYAGIEASGSGFDFGLLYRPPVAGDRLSLGLAVLDFQSGLQWSTGFDAIPPQMIQAGAAWHFDSNTVAAMDLEVVNDLRSPARSSVGYRLGAEYWLDLPKWNLEDVAALRLGWFQSDDVDGLFTFGLGFRVGEFHGDYAFVQSPSSLGETHRVSVRYHFGAEPGSGPRPTRTPGPTPSATPTPVLAQVDLELRPEPAAFTPGAKEGADATRVALLTEADLEIRAWSAVITDASGVEVLNARRESTRAPKAIRWDGKSKGTALPAGLYSIKVVLYGRGDSVIAEASAEIRLRAEGGDAALRLDRRFAVFAPGDASERSEAVFSPQLTGGKATGWQLRISRQGGAAVRVLRGSGSPPATLRWDGKDSSGRVVADGAYEASLVVTLSGGAKRTAVAAINVDTRRPGLGLETGLAVFTPGGVDEGSLGIFPTLARAGGLPVNWRVLIRDSSGRTVKTFRGRGLAPQRLSWDGRNDAGALVEYGAMFEVAYEVVTESGALARADTVAIASTVRPFDKANAIQVTLATIQFEPGDARLELDEYAKLKSAASAVKTYGDDYLVQLKGHVDENEGSGRRALELSRRRAQAVYTYLVESEGLPPARVAMAGYGAAQAMPGDGGLEHQARNRRVEVILYTK